MRAAILASTVCLAGGILLSRPSITPAPGPVADTSPPSAAWLALIPDGVRKRQFLLDCTGCHQFDGRIARPSGLARTREEWAAGVRKMLGYFGPETGFPIISDNVEPDELAAWLSRVVGERTPAAEPAAATVKARVQEFLFPVPQDLPHDLAIQPGGHIVVTGMFSHAMHVLDPASGQWTTVGLPTPQGNPRAIELDAAGRWWVVFGNPHQLARYDGTGWATWDVGIYAHSVALDSAGNAFVNGHFTRDPELIVRVDTAGAVRRFMLPRHPYLFDHPGGPIPYEIRTAPDGTIWTSELQGNRLIHLDPRTGRAEAVAMPTPVSGPRRFDIDANGVLWIPAYAAGLLVRYDPANGEFQEIPLPVKDALPYVARVDHTTGTVWIGTGAADALFGYHPAGGSFDVIPLPTRGALVRHLAIDPASHDVWLAYGESPGKAAARIARVSTDYAD